MAVTYPHYKRRYPEISRSIPAVLQIQAQSNPDQPCISWTDAGRQYSFSEVHSIVNKLARGLAKKGVKKGDYVVLILPNCLEYIFIWWALNTIGAIEVTIGDTYKGDILKHQVNLSQATIVITNCEIADRLAGMEGELPHVRQCYLLDASLDSVSRSPFNRISHDSFFSLYDDDDSSLEMPIVSREIASVLFTSGTTGLSKGVLMSHAQLHFFAEQLVELVGLNSRDVYMTGFPLFHANAQILTVYPCLLVGAHCVLYPNFSASDFIGRARRSGATVCNLLGATTSFICSQPESSGDRDHRLKRIYAAPMPPALGPVFTERFGVSEFLDAFGQTEISLPFMTPRGVSRPPGSSGVLVDQWFDARLVNSETDEDVAEGEVGELLIRHRSPDIICSGYLGMPDKTVETWRNLWFHTGDAMRRDSDGWYYFVDRVKDALRRRGENISSFEVETVVRSHPSVAECAVIGVKADEEGGEDEVKACIVLNDGQPATPEEIVRWCDDRMPPSMIPRFIEFMAILPQTPSQKIRKKELRDQGVTVNTWDRRLASSSSKGDTGSRNTRAAGMPETLSN
jgi:crotonobetaine/carnitine-CoA ligase